MTAATLAALTADAGLVRPSAVVRALGGERWEATLDAGRETYPASMVKLPVAAALAALARDGACRLEEVVTVEARLMTANDAPSPFVPGYAASLHELARAMLSDSDNVATNVLIDRLGRETITRESSALGLERTAVRRLLSGSLPLIDDPGATGRNAHPAADAATLLETVAREAERGRSWIFDALAAQRWNEKLAAGFDSADRFAHKTGDTDEVSHDGGILTLPDGRSFVVVVYTEAPADAATARRLASFARGLRAELARA